MPGKLARLLPLLFVFCGLPAALHAEDHFFTSAGVKIHYTGIIKGLSDSYQVIALDIRGHGQSDKPHEPAAYGSRMVDDVIHLMDHLRIRKAHLVGYSMGGVVTEALLTEHPDRLLTATLGGAGWNDPNDHGQEKSMNQLADSLEQGKGIAPLIVALNPVGAPPLPPQAVEMLNKMFLAANDPLALAAIARGQMPPVRGNRIRANRIPVLALIGEMDPVKASVDRLKGMLPNLKIVVIPGANHLTAFGDPLFLSSLKSFLADHSNRRAKAWSAGAAGSPQ